MIDFIGLGAQKSGTSWAYTCLYEHPEICMPVKEIHFFSRSRYVQGITWYEDYFKKCGSAKKWGEWSTSYLYSEDTPERIHTHYPDAKLLVILRNPIDRAYSQYRNAIRAGEIPKSATFESYHKQERSVIAQGLYAVQLERFLKYFQRDQLCILIYEDIAKDPIEFMQKIYTFLDIDATFVASMTHEHANVARTPKSIGFDRVIHHISEFLRRHGFDRLVHAVRKTGITEAFRKINTEKGRMQDKNMFDRKKYTKFFIDDVERLSVLLVRNMHEEWNI
jgi:Sulfotransferase domain